MNVLENLNYGLLKQIIVLLYTDNSRPERFSVGFPYMIINNDWIVLKAIDPHGFADGYLVRKINDVYKVELQDEYSVYIKKLFDFRNKVGQNVEFDLNKVDLLNELLLSVKDRVISVFNYQKDYFVGTIMDVSDTCLTLQQYDTYGHKKNQVEILLSDVCSVSVGSLEEIDLEVVINDPI